MTILVKANTAGKNSTGVALLPQVVQRPVKKIHKDCNHDLPMAFKKDVAELLTGLLVSTLVVLVVLGGALVIYRQLFYGTTVSYRGTCEISSTYNDDYIVLNDAPSNAWFGVPAGQLKVYASSSDIINNKVLSQILEDMAIEDKMETITVRDGQRAFQIIHDFDENITSIRADERCFIMDMIRDFVLEPSHLIASFHNESTLDLSHAHSFFRAELPPLSVTILSNIDLVKNCNINKPIYRLDLEDNLVLRKRSVAVSTTEPPRATEELHADNATAARSPKHDFVQFSGKHLQRITISNMDDILHYETTNIVSVHPKLRAAA